MAAPAPASEVPAGFVAIPQLNYIAINGPIYGRIEDKRLVLGLRAELRHCNPRGIVHGGFLMTLADMTLALCSNYERRLDRFLPTVKLEGDFLAPAVPGAWLEGRAQVLRVTRNLVFAAGLIAADGTAVLRASAILKLPAESDPRFNLLDPFAEGGAGAP